jgi:hypothetical protein
LLTYSELHQCKPMLIRIKSLNIFNFTQNRDIIADSKCNYFYCIHFPQLTFLILIHLQHFYYIILVNCNKLLPFLHKCAYNLYILLKDKFYDVGWYKYQTIYNIWKQEFIGWIRFRQVIPRYDHCAQVSQKIVETFSATLFTQNVVAYRLKPLRSERLKKFRVINYNFQNEYLYVDVCRFLFKLIQQILGELWHFRAFTPLIFKKKLHSLNASFNILHTPMLIHYI